VLDQRRLEGKAGWVPCDGNMAALIAAFDWSGTALGPMKDWPQSRLTAVNLMLCAPLPACIRWGRDGIILYNDAYAAFAGNHHPSLLGSPLSLAWPELANFTSMIMERGLQGQPVSLHDHHLVLHRYGAPEDVWADLSCIPLFDEAGEPAGVMEMLTEVTERVLAEQGQRKTRDLLESVNERLELALNAGPILGTWVWDMSADMLRADDRFARSFGLDSKRVEAGMRMLEILQTVHPDDQARVIEMGRRAVRDGEKFQAEYRALCPDGSYLWVQATGRCDRDAKGTPYRFPGVLIDINERKQAELALHESEARFRTMADNAPVLIWATDAEGRFTFANRRYGTEFGLDLNHLRCGDWRQMLHEDDAKIALPRFYEAVKARQPVTGELRMRNKCGELRWMRCDGVPRFDEAGDFLGYIGCNVDVTELYLAADVLEAKVAERTQAYAAITEQLQAEMLARERAEHALRQAHKMEAVGQLTGGLAHDFNNLLTGIIGNLELLQNRASRTGITEFDSYVEGARNAARRASALTHRLLAFSRRQTLEPRQLRLEDMMTDIEELIRRTVGPAIDLQVRHAPELWPTHCDQNQLENALLNLAINARDAMPEGGILAIETENVVLDQAFAAEQGDLAPGDYVAISVRDTGTGMSEDVIMRAFDPFFTTKPSGQGCLNAAMPEPEAPPVEEPRGGNGERVMIVDDESSVRLSVSEMLSDLGYQVLAAEDGPSALTMLEEAAPVDLMITDIGLPGMSGPQLAEVAKRARPGLKVLFITGYAENGSSTVFSPEPWMEIVAKPFTMMALAGKVEEMISS
jgi:PAS domain S-box-containing protein